MTTGVYLTVVEPCQPAQGPTPSGDPYIAMLERHDVRLPFGPRCGDCRSCAETGAATYACVASGAAAPWSVFSPACGAFRAVDNLLELTQ